jgi:hypothetical protein
VLSILDSRRNLVQPKDQLVWFLVALHPLDVTVEFAGGYASVMPSLTSFGWSSAVGVMIVVGIACEDPFGTVRQIALPITAVEAPASVNVGDAPVVRVTVQSGGCKRFEKLNAVRTPERVTIAARGTDSSGPRVSCPGDIRSDVVEYRAQPLLVDPFTVVAKQPDGSETIRTIRVFQ